MHDFSKCLVKVVGEIQNNNSLLYESARKMFFCFVHWSIFLIEFNRAISTDINSEDGRNAKKTTEYTIICKNTC